MAHLPPSREQPINLVELLQSSQPIEPAALRSQYPSWVDADIRKNLEEVLLEPRLNPTHQYPTHSQPHTHSNITSQSYQQVLSNMISDLKSKQYAIQHHHRQRSSLDDSYLRPTSPPRATGVPTALSQSVGSTKKRPVSRTSTTPGVKRTKSTKTSRPTSAILRTSGSNIQVPTTPSTIPSTHPIDHPQPPPGHPLSPRHSRNLSSGGVHSRSTSMSHPNTIAVSAEWFHDMEHKLQMLSQLGAPPSDELTKAAELQRMKYAMLITKLEEMNRLHREVLNEEHQKQHFHDLEQLQQQTIREFQTKLQLAQVDNQRLKEEHEKERRRLIEQKESERKTLERWSNEKDVSLDALRQHFLQREELMLQSHRQVEESFAKQKEAWHAHSLKELEERENERRLMETTRADLAKQVHDLRQQQVELQEGMNKKNLELDQVRKTNLLQEEELIRLRAKVSEANERFLLVDTLQSTIHRLQVEKSDREEREASKERYWKEQLEELEARETRLVRLRTELDEREAARREARRRERREVAQGVVDGIHTTGSLTRIRSDEFDSAWASGPLDRKQLVIPRTHELIQQRY